jgi:hypothetical protein
MFRARALAAVVAVVVAATLGYFFGGSAPVGGRAPLASAVASVPADVTVLGFTDWESIHSRYSSYEAIERDLSTRSALAEADLGQIRSTLGWELSDLSWEVYAQYRLGDVDIVGLKGDVPSAARLRKSGYELNEGIWRATGRLAAQEPLYRFLVPMKKRHLVVMSDGIEAVRKTVAVVEGRSASLAEAPHVADVTGALAGVDTALIQAGALGCEATTAAVDADTVNQVRAAQERFGTLETYRWLGRGLNDDGSHLQTFVVAMPFTSAVIASRQADVRAAMSVGPFIGRTAAMNEVLRLRSARTDGSTAVLTYAHPADSDYLMPGRGPLLPASC